MDIWKFLGQLIAYGGGAAAIAYVLFIFLGRNVVENWFSRRMEAYKNAQAQELEEFKYKINALFNRVTKIHEKEFEVLKSLGVATKCFGANWTYGFTITNLSRFYLDVSDGISGVSRNNKIKEAREGRTCFCAR